MKKLLIVFLAVVAVVLVGCHKNDDSQTVKPVPTPELVDLGLSVKWR